MGGVSFGFHFVVLKYILGQTFFRLGITIE